MYVGEPHGNSTSSGVQPFSKHIYVDIVASGLKRLSGSLRFLRCAGGKRQL